MIGSLRRRWALLGHQGALVNARLAATECSRRRVERVEIDAYVAARAAAYGAAMLRRGYQADPA